MAAGDGLIVMTPTSIDVTGTSGSINADGGVDFTAVTALSLNGVFTSSYDNYLIVANYDASADNIVTFRLRASGTDATAGNYTRQWLEADGAATPNGFRSSSTTAMGFGYQGTEWNGQAFHVYGPYLAQPTASRGVNVASTSGARLLDYASTHSLSTSYDGFTLLPGSGNITGNITVFGYEE